MYPGEYQILLGILLYILVYICRYLKDSKIDSLPFSNIERNKIFLTNIFSLLWYQKLILILLILIIIFLLPIMILLYLIFVVGYKFFEYIILSERNRKIKVFEQILLPLFFARIFVCSIADVNNLPDSILLIKNYYFAIVKIVGELTIQKYGVIIFLLVILYFLVPSILEKTTNKEAPIFKELFYSIGQFSKVFSFVVVFPLLVYMYFYSFETVMETFNRNSELDVYTIVTSFAIFCKIGSNMIINFIFDKEKSKVEELVNEYLYSHSFINDIILSDFSKFRLNKTTAKLYLELFDRENLLHGFGSTQQRIYCRKNRIL